VPGKPNCWRVDYSVTECPGGIIGGIWARACDFAVSNGTKVFVELSYQSSKLANLKDYTFSKLVSDSPLVVTYSDAPQLSAAPGTELDYQVSLADWNGRMIPLSRREPEDPNTGASISLDADQMKLTVVLPKK
jgi:hypothetical protein